MRKDPIRLEGWLTRDCVDRAEKLRALAVREPNEQTISTADIITTVTVLALVIIWIVMSW